MTDEDITDTSLPIYYFDTEYKNYNDEILKFKKWLAYNKINPQYFLNDSEYYLIDLNGILLKK
jgi:hypothetical protein